MVITRHLVSALVLGVTGCRAMLAYSGDVEHVTGDGSVITLKMHGDAFNNFMTYRGRRVGYNDADELVFLPSFELVQPLDPAADALGPPPNGGGLDDFHPVRQHHFHDDRVAYFREKLKAASEDHPYVINNLVVLVMFKDHEVGPGARQCGGGVCTAPNPQQQNRTLTVPNEKEMERLFNSQTHWQVWSLSRTRFPPPSVPHRDPSQDNEEFPYAAPTGSVREGFSEMSYGKLKIRTKVSLPARTVPHP